MDNFGGHHKTGLVFRGHFYAFSFLKINVQDEDIFGGC